jgi:hypothetical protein
MPDQEPLTLALSRRERGLIEVFGGDTPTCDTALNSDFEALKQEPLTLTLSRRERGLTEVFGRAAPTGDTELNAHLEKPTIGSLSLGRGLG